MNYLFHLVVLDKINQVIKVWNILKLLDFIDFSLYLWDYTTERNIPDFW